MIQRCFWRAYRRDEEGEIDETLIPQGILDWHGEEEEEESWEESDGNVEMDAEEDTDFEEESDYS